MFYICKIPCPIGLITAASDGENITGLWFEGQKYFPDVSDAKECELPIFKELRRWLDCYFTGHEPDFALPLLPCGSEFRREVWRILLEITYGKLITYGDIAKRIEKDNKGRRTSARAVGGAVGHNPISIIIPCHRVVGANGDITGYAGGIDKKIQLLKLEKAIS